MKSELKFSDGRLICPGCFEPLAQEDIEGFSRCPYCSHLFKADPEIEDFLLEPLVDQWIAHSHNQFDGKVSQTQRR